MHACNSVQNTNVIVEKEHIYTISIISGAIRVILWRKK